MVLFKFVGSAKPETTLSSLSIYISHIQVTGICINLSFNWPPEFKQFIRTIFGLFSFSLSDLAPAPECSFQWSAEQRYYFNMSSLPIMLGVALLPALLIFIGSRCAMGLYACKRKKTLLEVRSLHKSLAVCVVILSIMYGFIASKAVEVMDCSLPSGTEDLGAPRYLDMDPAVTCTTRHYLTGTFFVLLYTLGVPISLFIFLRGAAKRNSLWREESWIPNHVGWLYLRFERHFFWWELVNMLCKCLLGLIMVLGEKDPEAQFWLTQIILTGALILQGWARPYASMQNHAKLEIEEYSYGLHHKHGISLKPNKKHGGFGTEVSKVLVNLPLNKHGHTIVLGDVISKIHDLPLPQVSKKIHAKDAWFYKSNVDKEGRTPLLVHEVETYMRAIRAKQKYVLIHAWREKRFTVGDDDEDVKPWSDEDRLAFGLMLINLIMNTFGKFSPPRPQETFASARDAAERIGNGDASGEDDGFKTAQMVTLVFLYICFFIGAIHLAVVMVRVQMWKFKRNHSVDHEALQHDEEISQYSRTVIRKEIRAFLKTEKGKRYSRKSLFGGIFGSSKSLIVQDRVDIGPKSTKRLSTVAEGNEDDDPKDSGDNTI